MADITPIDYSLNVATPFQTAMQGYQAGAAIRDDQAQQAALLAKQQASRQQAQMLQQLANNPNATGNDYARVMTMIPGAAEPLTKAWTALNATQQQSHLSDLAQWGSAIKSGQPQIAADGMSARADAIERTSGAPTPESQALRVQSQIASAHPAFMLGQIQAQLSAHPDGSKAATTLAALGAEDRATAEAPANLAIKNAEAQIKGADAAVAPVKVTTDIQNTQSQIDERSKRLGLDRDKLTSDVQLELAKLQQKNGELPEYVAKDVNTAATDAIAAQSASNKMNDLASQIEKAAAEGDMPGGIKAQQFEILKKTLGLQNETTRLRAEYSRIVTPAAMAAYKQVASGSTSDKDIETAMVGVPKDTDAPERMVSFLRGAAKLQVYESVLNNAKSEWLGAVRTLGKAKADTEIDGVKVPAGMSFKEFTDVYLPRKVTDKTNDAVIKNSPYAQFATPAPVQPAGQ